MNAYPVEISKPSPANLLFESFVSELHSQVTVSLTVAFPLNQNSGGR